MNTKSKARAPGRRLTLHLGRQDTNEHVSLGSSRGVTPQLKAAMDELAIRSATVAARKSWFHIVGNPDPKEALDEAGWNGYWADVEAEYSLGQQSFVEVIHRKHGRDHRHRVYSLVRDDGRLVSVSFNFRRNEFVSRLCEIANGHRLCPGKHHRWVLGWLAERGLKVPIAAPPHTSPGVGFGQDEQQQAERTLGSSPRPFREAVYGMYVAAGGDWRAFAKRLDQAGITVARGHKAFLVIDEASRFHVPLARLLREEAKRAGSPIRITSSEIEAAFGRAKKLSDENDAIRERQSRARADSEAAPERKAEAPEDLTAEFGRRMAIMLQDVLALEQRRQERLRRNRLRNATRRRPAFDAAVATLADAACLEAASHLIRCHRDERLARRTAMVWIAAMAAVNGIAPILLVVAAIGLVRRYEKTAERRRFRADVDSVKAARAGFQFGDVPSGQRSAYAALARALRSGRLEHISMVNIDPNLAAQFVAWWVHATDRQQDAILRWEGRKSASSRNRQHPRSRRDHDRSRG